jgi:polysaccharide biosynthesis protein PslH
MTDQVSSQRAKILVTMIGFPYPPASGGQLRDYNLLRSLAEEFDIYLLIMSSSDFPVESAIDEMQKYCQYVEIIRHEYKHSLFLFIKSLLKKVPYKIFQYTSLKFKTRIRELLNTHQFNLIFCDHIYLTDNLPTDINLPVIPHTEDAFSFLYKQVAEQARFIRKIYASLQWKILFDYEIKIFKKYGIFIAVSQEEKKKIAEVLPGIKIPIIPNGIDLLYFKPQNTSNKNDLNLVFVGLMDSFPNEDAVTFFVKEIFPFILKKNDKIKFFVVGKNPTGKVQSLNDNKNIFVTGTVDDVRPFIAKATIYVVPLRLGTGTRLKILEAMSMGIPVISTSIGCEGLNAEDNKNIIISDEPGNFAAGIINLIEDDELRKQIALEGRKLAEQYSWVSIGQNLNNFIFSILKN